MKVTILLFAFISIVNISIIKANSLEKEYIIHDDNPKVTAKLIYSYIEPSNNLESPTSINFEPENINFDFSKMIGTYKDDVIEGTISFSFSSSSIKIEVIINTKDTTKFDENWSKIQKGVKELLDGENLIRFMAMYVSGGKVSKGDERKAILGAYYDDEGKKHLLDYYGTDCTDLFKKYGYSI